MPQGSKAVDREALVALFARMDNQASVVAIRALIRAHGKGGQGYW